MANIGHRSILPHPTAVGTSVVSAFVLDAWLVWFLLIRADFNPPVGEAEFFWVRQFVGMTVYFSLQQYTLATLTGRSHDAIQAFDSFMAATPLVVTVALLAYEIGVEGWGAITWRHWTTGAAWSVVSLVDALSTSITNQRLRARQLGTVTAD